MSILVQSLLNLLCPLYMRVTYIKISTKVLEFSKTTIAPYLANTFNKCEIQGYFPYELKAECNTQFSNQGTAEM